MPDPNEASPRRSIWEYNLYVTITEYISFFSEVNRKDQQMSDLKSHLVYSAIIGGKTETSLLKISMSAPCFFNDPRRFGSKVELRNMPKLFSHGVILEPVYIRFYRENLLRGDRRKSEHWNRQL